MTCLHGAALPLTAEACEIRRFRAPPTLTRLTPPPSVSIRTGAATWKAPFLPALTLPLTYRQRFTLRCQQRPLGVPLAGGVIAYLRMLGRSSHSCPGVCRETLLFPRSLTWPPLSPCLGVALWCCALPAEESAGLIYPRPSREYLVASQVLRRKQWSV